MWIYQFAVVFFAFAMNRGELPRVMVRPRSAVCIKQGNRIALTCLLDLNTSFSNTTKPWKNFTLVWYQDGLPSTNATSIHHRNNSISSSIEVVSAGLFTCSVMQISHPESKISENSSISVGMRPNFVTNLIATPKFISDQDTFRYVMVSWLRQSIEYVYSVFFKIDLFGCYPSPCVEDTVDATCNGTECTALIDTEGHDLSDLAFYIVTRHGTCEATSAVWNFNLTLSSCGVLPPKTLFYFPYPPTKLTIQTAYRSVTLRWQDVISWIPPSASLTYTCSKTWYTVKFKKIDIRIIYLFDKHIRAYAPYRKCTFCLSVQEYHCGRFSEPLCRTTRLREEPPSKAPKFTCTTYTCPTSYDYHFRNLTVTWELPAKKYWGGVLRQIKIRYAATELNSTWQLIVLINVSSKSVVITGLNKTLHYSVYVQACNTEGCSGYSDQLLVYGIRARPLSLTENNSSSNYVVIILYSIGGGICFILVILAWVVIGSKTKLFLKQRTGLESLSETDIPEYNEPSDKMEYNELDQMDNEQFEQLPS